MSDIELPDLPSRNDLELFAKDLCSKGRLIWLGFRQDEDGLYTIPVISNSDAKLVEEFAQHYARAAILADREKRAQAAQPKSDDVDRLLHEVLLLCKATEDAPEVEPKNEHQRGFDRGRRFEAKGIHKAIGAWFQNEFCGRTFMGEPALDRVKPEWRNLMISAHANLAQPSRDASKPVQAEAPTASNEREALREALTLALEYWRHRQQRYKNRHPVWVEKATAALATQQEAPNLCANCGKEGAAIHEGDPEGDVWCSSECYDQHGELGCPHETHNGFRHPVESRRLIECEDVLRSLASWLSAGGYNAPTVDPKVFEEKIRWGVDEAIKDAVRLATQQEAQPQAERETVDKKINKRHALNLIQELIKAERDDAYDEGRRAAQTEPAGGDKEDAERYRWLRDKSPSGWALMVDGLSCWKFDYDAAIDAARAAQQATGEQDHG